MSVDWFEWGDEAFAAAREQSRPVLLYLYASWCRFCRRLEREVLADERVDRLLRERFVPVRVDKDRRPEVNDRYNLGGWPTLAVLTPDGELLTGTTFLAAPELSDLLERVLRYHEGNQQDIAEAVRTRLAADEEAERGRRTRASELRPTILQKVQDAILADFDRESGGFGAGQKFPHWEALDFALLRFVRTGDERLRDVVERTLSAMASSPLHDSLEGGFFRYSATRDWRSPHTEKLLETNVGLLRNYLEAFQVLERADFRHVAVKIAEFLRDRLRCPDVPAFCGSLDSDDEYYALDAEGRRRRGEPHVDPTVYVNWNAAAVSALFKASAVLEDPQWGRLAEDTLGFLLEECYDPGRGMYHYHHDGARHLLGLLTDQAYTARALLHAAQFTGDRRYLEVAEDLLQILMQRQTAAHGGFYDIRVEADAVGSLRRRNQSILENGLIAEVFLRAFHLTMRDEYRGTAERTLALFAADYHLYGYFTAGYARAVDLFLVPPVHVVIVGPRSDPASQALVAAANEVYLPSKLVQVLDPEQDDDLLARFDLTRESTPVAYVNVERTHVARVLEPAALQSAMRRADRSRGVPS